MAEARVWYVGVTRAREHLHIVLDKGGKYELPPVKKEDAEIKDPWYEYKINYTEYLTTHIQTYETSAW